MSIPISAPARSSRPSNFRTASPNYSYLENTRPAVLCFCSGLGRGRARTDGNAISGGRLGAGGVAHSPGAASRPKRRCAAQRTSARLLARRGSACSARQRPAHNASRSSSHAAPSWDADTGREHPRHNPRPTRNRVRAMNAYVGTPTSRSTAAPRSRGPPDTPANSRADGLLHRFVVEATISMRAHCPCLDASERCRSRACSTCSRMRTVRRLADKDEAWKDEVAPEEGSPFRPLYDDTIKFNGQPIALVVAEDGKPRNSPRRSFGR